MLCFLSCLDCRNTIASVKGINVDVNTKNILRNSNDSNSISISKFVDIMPTISANTGYIKTFNNGIASFSTSITGYYDIPFKFDLPSCADSYYGYFAIESQFQVDMDDVFSNMDDGFFSFGQPSVIGLLPSSVGAVSSLVSDKFHFPTDGTFFAPSLYTTLTLHGLPASGDCVVGYTVRVPFSITFVSRSANSVSLENKFYQQLLSTSLRVFHGYNNVETYPVPLIGDIESIKNYMPMFQDHFGKMRENQKQQLEKAEEQLNEQKKQGEEKRGFFKTIVDWVTGFPDMLVGIVIPNNDVIPIFLNDMTEFLNEHLGFVMFPFDLFGKFLDVFYTSSDDTSLTFPGFSIMGHTVWESQEFDLASVFYHMGFAGDTLQDAIYFIFSVIMVGAFVNLCYKKFSSVVKGSEAD